MIKKAILKCDTCGVQIIDDKCTGHFLSCACDSNVEPEDNTWMYMDCTQHYIRVGGGMKANGTVTTVNENGVVDVNTWKDGMRI